MDVEWVTAEPLVSRRYVQRLETASTPEQVRGILLHDVLSRFFDLPAQSRDIDNLHELFRASLMEFKAREKEVSRLDGTEAHGLHRMPPPGSLLVLVPLRRLVRWSQRQAPPDRRACFRRG